MRFTLLFIFLLLVVTVPGVLAQDEEKPPCAQPFSILFDEFAAKDSVDTNARLTALIERFGKEDRSQATADVHVYAGRKTRIGEADALISQIKNFISQNSVIADRVRTYNAGYRDVTTVELYIQPLTCSRYAPMRSDYGVEDIDLEEAPADTTQVKTPDEIESAVRKRTEISCPPAARAVRACPGSVVARILIDEKGDVVFAEAVSGHPLLKRTAATIVEKWKFAPFKQNKKPVKVFGNITLHFPDPADNDIETPISY